MVGGRRLAPIIVTVAMPGPDRDGSTPPVLRDPLLWVSVVIAAALCAPFFRYVFWLGDEGVILHGAERILRGETLYRDFFEFLPPGSFLLVAAWMKAIGPGLASVRLLVVGVIAAIAALTYAAARLSSGNRPLAVVLAVAWAALSQGGWTVVSHHWFATLASMACAVALLSALGGRRTVARLFVSGVFAGTAAMMISTRGALLCLAVAGIALTLPERRTVVAALAGIAVVPAATLGYLAVTGAIGPAVVDVVLFPARHYSGIQVVAFGAAAIPYQTPVAIFFPLTFLLAGTSAILGQGTTWRDPCLRATLALAIVGLLGAFPRPDVTHIAFTAPLACPLFARVLTGLLGRFGRGARFAVSASLLAVCALTIGYRLAGVAWPMVMGPLSRVSTARGTFVGPPSPWIEAVGALVPHIERAPRDAAYFFYPYHPMLPYLTGRRHVAPLDVIVPGYTNAAQYREVCRRVLRDADWLVVDHTWIHPVVLRTFFPSMADPDPPEKRALEAALARTFTRVVHAWGGMELRGRGPAPPDAACDGR
jgi:hypothetical protein